MDRNNARNIPGAFRRMGVWGLILAALAGLGFGFAKWWLARQEPWRHYAQADACLPRTSPAFLFFLPAGPPEKLTPPEVAAITGLAQAWQEGGGRADLCIIGPEKLRGLCAAMVLYSYGASPAQVSLAGNLADVPW